MTSIQLAAMSPLIILGASAFVVMLAIAVRRSHALAAWLTAAGLIASMTGVFAAWRCVPCQVTPLFLIDGFGLFFTGLILAAALIITLLAYDYWRRDPGRHEEFYLLLLLATLGAIALVSSSHFAALFVSLELLSISLYAMIGYKRTSPRGLEGAIKYLVLAAVSSAFLLFGMALVYARAGTMEFSGIADIYNVQEPELLAWVGLAMMLVGIGFKLAVVPFHQWTPDVYQGAPVPVTAFVATVSKGAMFAVLARFYWQSHFEGREPLVVVFTLIAVASMVFGNLLALMQDNLKRMLAYSSIAHLGYLIVVFIAGGSMGASAAAFYLAAYFATTLGAFGVISVLSHAGNEPQKISDFSALAWRRPWTAAVLMIMMLSLAGIPLTAGFLAKFYVLNAGVHSNLWALLLVMIATSVVGLYYYLRVIVVLFSRPRTELAAALPAVRVGGAIALLVVTVIVLWLGIYPSALIRLIEAMPIFAN